MQLPDRAQVRRLACVNLGEIGDVIVSLPTVHALRERYPDAVLTLVVRAQLKSLVEHDPAIDALLLHRGGGSLPAKLQLLARVAARRWDLWVDLHTPTFNTFGSGAAVDRRNALLARAAGAKHTLGFATPRLAPRLSHAVSVPSDAELAAENIVDITLRLAAAPAGSRAKRIEVPDEDAQWAGSLLAASPLAGLRIIGLFTGAKQPAKVWPLENVRQFCLNVLRADARVGLLLIGGPHEVDNAARLIANLPADLRPRILDRVGADSLRQTAALMRHCAAVVATDSGPMHLAEAVNAPLVALMSSHNHLPVWRPQAKNAIVLNVPVPCGPCFSQDCSQNQLCMRSISGDDAALALRRLLAESS
jgi:ADP-heptose:LPS heptosyltransferase